MLKDYKSLELDKILQQLANETTCADAAAPTVYVQAVCVFGGVDVQ